MDFRPGDSSGMSGKRGAIGHRPEIDGLRAVAVLPVILFHAGFDAFSGGYVGVDVFFVISGYLITSIILREHGAGAFTLVGFYERRARRILPALFVVMLACLPAAWLWMRPVELESFGLSLFGVTAFVSNILFWRESGYFDGAAELKPLLHTWSLGIEEQYYLFFPLFVGLVLWLRARWLVIAFAVIGVTSFLISLWLTTASPSANFFLIPSRAWELMAGSLLATAGSRRPRNSLSLLGLALILGPVFLYDAATPFPGLAALPQVIGTVLIIAFTDSRSAVGRMLTLRPMLWLGLISYSAYLWHQPLFAFARLMSANHLHWWVYLVLSCLALGLAHLTRQWIELPFIGSHPRRFTRRQIFAWAGLGSVSFASVGLVLVFGAGFPDRAPAEPEASSIKGCPSVGRGVHACSLGVAGQPSIAVLGDSYAYDIADVLNAELTRQGRSGVLLHTACHPIPGIYDSRRPPTPERVHTCTTANIRMMELATAPAIENVIVAVRWTLRLADEDEGFDNGEGGVETDAPFRRNLTINGSKAQAVERYFAALGSKRVTVLYPVPEAGWNPARVNMVAYARGRPLADITTSRRRFVERNAEAVAVLDSIPGVRRVRPDAVLCGERRCKVQVNGVLYYSDDDHLSWKGASLLLPYLLGDGGSEGSPEATPAARR